MGTERTPSRRGGTISAACAFFKNEGDRNSEWDDVGRSSVDTSKTLMGEKAPSVPSVAIACTRQKYVPGDRTGSISGVSAFVSETISWNASSRAICTRYVAAPGTGYQLNSTLSCPPKNTPLRGKRTATPGWGLGFPGVTSASENDVHSSLLRATGSGCLPLGAPGAGSFST